MASALRCKASSIVSSLEFLGQRLPLFGAFLMLSLGLTNITRSLSSSSHKIEGSKIAKQQSNKGICSSAMEGGSSSVPSIVVYVTVPNKEAGQKLAASIVKEKLAACVNRVPGIESVYEWKGEVQTDAEELLIIKTRESLLTALTDHVKDNHEYEVPEVIALPIIAGNVAYLEWIKNNTRE